MPPDLLLAALRRISTLVAIGACFIILGVVFLFVSIPTLFAINAWATSSIYSHYIPLIAILVYLPFVCIGDWKSRSFDPALFMPLVIIGSGSLYTYLIESPLRNYYLFALSVVLCGILIALALFRAIGGADAIFASLIILIMQYNPLTPIRIFFPLDFVWALLIISCAMPIFAWVNNRRLGNKYGVIEMLTQYRDHVPYMFVIAAAFLVTLVAEVTI